MKTRLTSLLIALAVLVVGANSFAQGTQVPQPPNLRLKGTNNEVPSGVEVKVNGTLSVKNTGAVSVANTATAPELCRRFYLGAPIAATTNRIVTSTNMLVGAYTIAAQPDVPRNITVTATTVTGADTPGTIVVVGTDYRDAVITETIVPSQGSTVAGTKAFKTVTSVTGAGWVISTGNDTVVIGVGTVLGLPVVPAEAGYTLTTLDATAAGSVVTTGAISASTVAVSGVDGSKKLYVYIAR